MSSSELSPPSPPEVVVTPFQFRTEFHGWMEMYAPVSVVEEYLDAHPGWFVRCARPMQAEPVGDNGYILTIGRFGSFGYLVEPKIGLHLLPQQERVYRIETFPVPDQPYLNYEVDFQAQMCLAPIRVNGTGLELGGLNLEEYTHVTWDLDLRVEILFPKFIYHLPHRLLQTTGDQVLIQIVKQASHRLTAKVQADFHRTLGITLPKRSRRQRFHATPITPPHGPEAAALADKLPPNPDL